MPNEPKTLDEFKAENPEEGQLLRAYLKRKGGRCLLYIEVADEIEEFFSSDTRDESSEWHNSDAEGSYHEYYYKNYSSEFEKHVQMKNDSFGGDYVKNDHVNIALLRTVGLSNGIEFELPAQYSEDTLLESMKELKEEVEIIYKQFIRPVSITGSLTLTDF